MNKSLLVIFDIVIFMLSKKSKYAIKALVSLAKHFGEGGPLKISTIAEEEKIPRKFLESILVELRNNGLVHSKMGASGGYSLAKHPEEIVLSQIIRIYSNDFAGPISINGCECPIGFHIFSLKYPVGNST